MLTEYNVLKPDIARPGQIELDRGYWEIRRAQFEQEWLEFFDAWREWAGSHDELWRSRFWSVQAANDVHAGKIDITNPAHWGWMMIEASFDVAAFAFSTGVIWMTVVVGGGVSSLHLPSLR